MIDIPGVKTFSTTKIIGLEHIKFGKNIIIDDFVFIYATDEHVFGDYIHIASFVSITGGGRCYLEDFVSIASGSRVITGTDDFLGNGLINPTIPDEFRAVKRGLITIRKHSIVGVNTVILPDIVIGEGCAVGAGSVITEDLDPWGVYVGAPARRIKDRPREKILEYEKRLREKYG